MTDEVAMDGPFEVELKVHIISKDKTRSGAVSMGMAAGSVPTAEQVKSAIAEAEKAVSADGFRLMDRHEFIKDCMGIDNMAVPGPQTFRAD